MFLARALKLTLNTIEQIGKFPTASACADSNFELHLIYGEHQEDIDGVTLWLDASSYGRDYEQPEAIARPRWEDGYEFDGNDEFLTQITTASALTLSSVFTIGFVAKARHADMNNIVAIADSSTNNDFIRITSETEMIIKAAGQSRTFTLNTTLPDNQAFTCIITRDSSHVARIFINGTLQTDTETFSVGKALDIDTIGCRDNQINDFKGKIGEVIIYSCDNATTRADMQTRLNIIKNSM